MNKNTILRTAVRIVLSLLFVASLAASVFAVVYAPSVNADSVVVPTIDSTHTEFVNEETVETNPPLVDEPILFEDVGYEALATKQLAVNHKELLISCINQLKTEYTTGSYTDEAMTAMLNEISRLESAVEELQYDIDQFTKWEQEYAYAAEVWQYLTSRGLSKEATAGIIGNMMIETSGGSLALKPTIYDPARAYYGLCQWSLYYRPGVADMSFEDQLDYLYKDMPGEFKEFGFCYKRGFTYEDFINMESPEDAALAFAKVYERCASGSYGLRKQAARKAYNYFVGE